MSYYALDGRFVEGLLLDPLDDQGRPQRLVYPYKSPEGMAPVEFRVSNSIAWVEVGDDGSSWTLASMPRGAVLAVEVYGKTDLRVVHKQLVGCHARREALAAAEQGGASHGAPSTEPHVLNPESTDPADTDKDGTVSKSERKKWNREHPDDQR
jgi:hypothetical protein